MKNHNFEPIKTKIVFKRNSQNGSGEILYIYNRESFDDLNIDKQSYDNSQLLRLNQEISIDGNNYKITEVYFKLEKDMVELNDSFHPNNSKEGVMSHNSQVVVLVESLS